MFGNHKHYSKIAFVGQLNDLISCEIPEDGSEESKQLKDIVSSVQKHHHTKSCLKYNGKCRYGFPKLPAETTALAKPLPSTMDEIPGLQENTASAFFFYKKRKEKRTKNKITVSTTGILC